jgi:hypothetical protein
MIVDYKWLIKRPEYSRGVFIWFVRTTIEPYKTGSRYTILLVLLPHFITNNTRYTDDKMIRSNFLLLLLPFYQYPFTHHIA